MKKYEVKLKLTRAELVTMACFMHGEEYAFAEIAQGYNSVIGGRKIKPITKQQALRIADVLYRAEDSQ